MYKGLIPEQALCVFSPTRQKAGMNTHHQPKITINQPVEQIHICVLASAPDQAFGVTPNTKLILVETQKGQKLDTVYVQGSHLLATCHFLSVATQLTSFGKYVFKNFRKKKKPTQNFFPSLYAFNRYN